MAQKFKSISHALTLPNALPPGYEDYGNKKDHSLEEGPNLINYFRAVSEHSVITGTVIDKCCLPILILLIMQTALLLFCTHC